MWTHAAIQIRVITIELILLPAFNNEVIDRKPARDAHASGHRHAAPE
jgi:hypothetical protein